MSCHAIGAAMSDMGSEILEMYESGEITHSVCTKLVRMVVNGVGYCDGNHGEATEFLEDRCGCCFKETADLVYPESPYEENTDSLVDIMVAEKHLCVEHVCRDCLEKFRKEVEG